MQNVILIGLGALGLTYASKLQGKCNLKVLTDEEHLAKYEKSPILFNGIEQTFDFVLPSEKYSADLIIIAVKSNGLPSAINCIQNYVSSNTHIISLINGISSEKIISEAYPNAKVIKSYFIGHSAVREGNSVIQDGIGEIVIEHNQKLERFFDLCNIKYSVPDNIDYSMWLKFTFNLFSNQLSAILKMNFGELKKSKRFIDISKKIIKETAKIAKSEKIQGVENLEYDSLELLNRMCDEGKTSMLQDILAHRPTEIDIFAGEIIKLGKKHGIKTPYNELLYNLIKTEEENYIEYSIHSC